MKKIKNTFIIMVIMFLSIITLSTNVNAATSIRASASKVTNGKNVSVTVSFGESVSAAQFILNYDTSKFQYVSCSKGELSGNTYAYLSLTDSNDLSSVTFNFKAKALGSGKFTISGLILPNKSNNISGGSVTVTVQKATTPNNNNNNNSNNNKPKPTPTPSPTPSNEPNNILKNELVTVYAEIQDLVESDYTGESWKALQDAISKAEAATTEAEYDEVKSFLTVDNLVIASFEKTELNQLLRDLIGKAEEDYTEESWKELQEVIDFADDAQLRSEYEKIKDKLTINSLVEETDKGNSIINFFQGLDEQERISLALGACVAILTIIIIIVLILYRREKNRNGMSARRLK